MIPSDLRHIDCLRVAVTDPCNSRCASCSGIDAAECEEPACWLGHGETAHLIGLLARLGVTSVRLTGGEPLRRRALVDLVGRVAALPALTELSLSTNGSQLATHARNLRSAGLTDLNVSPHSLNPECHAQLTSRDGIRRIKTGILAAKRAGFASMKTNIVMLAGRPLGDLESLADFVLCEGLALRLIEPLPPGAVVQDASHVALYSLLEKLVARHGLLPCGGSNRRTPASDWINPTGGAGLEVMSYRVPRDREHPGHLLLTTDGTLCQCSGKKACLRLGAMLRAGASDAQLTAAIRSRFSQNANLNATRETAPKISVFLA